MSEKPNKRLVEFIESYWTGGECGSDYKWNDNHGELVRCKDCKYFEIKDFWGEFNGISILGASDQPTCTKWGGVDCKTSPDGYCFIADRR